MAKKFNIGDPVRVREGYPFAGFIGQVNSEGGESCAVILSLPSNSPPQEVRFAERELELITEAKQEKA